MRVKACEPIKFVLCQFATPEKVARLQSESHWLCVQAERFSASLMAIPQSSLRAGKFQGEFLHFSWERV